MARSSDSINSSINSDRIYTVPTDRGTYQPLKYLPAILDPEPASSFEGKARVGDENSLALAKTEVYSTFRSARTAVNNAYQYLAQYIHFFFSLHRTLSETTLEYRR